MNFNDIIGKLGGKKFVQSIVSVLAVALVAIFGREILSEKMQELIVYAIGGISGAYNIGQGISDGLTGGLTSSLPGTPEAKPNNGDLG